MDKRSIPQYLSLPSKGLICKLADKSDIPFMRGQEQKYEKLVGQWSEEKHHKAFENTDIAQLIFESEGESLGYVIIQGLQSPNKSLELSRITIAKPKQGFGTLIINQIIKFCFENLKFHRLWLDVVDYNKIAFSLYQKLGFVLEGTLRESDFMYGEFHSLHVLSILENEYFNN